VVDYERGRNEKGWLPMRLGGGLGGEKRKSVKEKIINSWTTQLQRPKFNRLIDDRRDNELDRCSKRQRN